MPSGDNVLSTLFTINRSWYQHAWLFEQLAFASRDDAILLIEDAVLSLQSPIALASFTAKCEAKNISLLVLSNDLQQRGIENKYKTIQPIDYAGMVDLVGRHDKQVAW